MNLRITTAVLLASGLSMGMSTNVLADDQAAVKGEAKVEAESGFFSRTMDNIRGMFGNDEQEAEAAQERAAEAKAAGQDEAAAASGKAKDQMESAKGEAGTKAAEKQTDAKAKGKAAADSAEEAGGDAASSGIEAEARGGVKLGE